MTSTRRVTSRGCGRGTTIVRWSAAAIAAATSSMFSASSRKSSSSTIVSANSSMSAGGLASTATGIRPTRCGARKLIAARSSPHPGGDPGPLDLHDDVLAGVQPRPVHLGDRGRGDGLGANSVNSSSSVHPRSASTTRRHGGERLGGDPVAQQLELTDELRGEDPLARREDLAELDVGGAEPLEGEPQPVGEARRAIADWPLRRSTEPPAGDRPAEDGRDPQHPPPRREPPPPHEAGDRAPRTDSRTTSRPTRQGRSSGATSQGGWSENAPTDRSAGAPGRRQGRHRGRTRGSRCARRIRRCSRAPAPG